MLAARLTIFLDNDGVMNDNRVRGLQGPPFLAEFFMQRLGGKSLPWIEANFVVTEALLESSSLDARFEAASDYLGFDRQYQIDWVTGMCTRVGVAVPTEEECIRLAAEANVFINKNIEAALPGAVETIRELYRLGYPLHTASSENSNDLFGYLAGMGVRDCFGRLYGQDLINVMKGGPLYYKRIFADLGILPADALVVDDNPHAIIWAVRAGARAVLVRKDAQLPLEKVYQIDSLADLPALLQRLER